METSPEEEHQRKHPVVQPQDMEVAESLAADKVPEQIVVSTGSASTNDKKERRRHRKDKEKVTAKRKSSSSNSSKHRKTHSDKLEGGENSHHKHRSKEHHRSKRHHRKGSRSKRSKDLDPNDPETIAKGRDLLLAAMGVKKEPDIEPCFVNAKANLDNNPIYQCNKQRLVRPQSESLLSRSASEAESVDVLHIKNNHVSTTAVGEPQSAVDNEYDQFVDFWSDELKI